jgi:tetraacyldisaccharide 4'-kinase
MSRRSLYRRIIAGETGTWSVPLLAFLRAVESLYGCAVGLRNARYDRFGPRTELPIPVISVGNLTVGGTGKTPFVVELLKRLDRMGSSPAVVSRGYKSADGQPNDEERLIRQSVPSAVCIAQRNRAWGGEVAHRSFGADVIVLDDGFQHRQLARNLDIVLVDATCPFGFDHLLPRGLLREPVDSLRRADMVVLTRCDQASLAALSRTEARVREITGARTCLKCIHRVISVENLDGTPAADSLERKRVVLFAGIAQPSAFVTTVASLGVEVVGERWWPDHHHYRRRDVHALRRPGRFPPHDLLLTTEKDAVKLAELDGLDNTDVVVVKVAIDFVGEGSTMLQARLDEALHER